MKAIDPGELNKRIEIFTRGNTGVDTAGFPLCVETMVRKCFAKVSRTSITEISNSQGDWKAERLRFLVRYTPVEINRTMYVRYRSAVYEIEYVNNYGDSDQYVEISAVRTVKS